MGQSFDVLLLADEKPGHYHLSEGVITALERLAPVRVTRIETNRRRWVPGRVLSRMVNGHVQPETILRLGYGLRLADLPGADFVVSAGGNTLGANVAVTRALKSKNIFIGSLRRYPPENFNLVITSYQRYSHLPRHLVALKPTRMDPDSLGRPENVPVFGADNPPATGGLLIGGNTPDFSYQPDEWLRLIDALIDIHRRWGTKWLVSNSRRTPGSAGDLFARAANRTDAIAEFIDYRSAGPGTLAKIFSTADIVLCTEDSSTMISEAIASRLPVIGVAPKVHAFTSQESEYRDYLQGKNWTRTLAISDLSQDSLDKALSELRPMRENHLDQLAKNLQLRFPGVFE